MDTVGVSELRNDSLAVRRARAQIAVANMRKRSQEKGAREFTLDEINAEIREVRRQNRR